MAKQSRKFAVGSIEHIVAPFESADGQQKQLIGEFHPLIPPPRKLRSLHKHKPSANRNLFVKTAQSLESALLFFAAVVGWQWIAAAPHPTLAMVLVTKTLERVTRRLVVEQTFGSKARKTER